MQFWCAYEQNVLLLVWFPSLPVESKNIIPSLLMPIKNTGIVIQDNILLCQPSYYQEHGQLLKDKPIGFFEGLRGDDAHTDVFLLYMTGKIKQMFTGFVYIENFEATALYDGENKPEWVHHSWGMDENDRIIETKFGINLLHCIPSLTYFGVPVPVDSSTMFSVPSKKL